MPNYQAFTVSDALPQITSDLLKYGSRVDSRNGAVREFLNVQITITNPSRREVLCTGRKANVFAQIAETCWVLSGRNDIEWLSAYLPRAVDYSDDGKVWRSGYGPRIRNWGGLDQVQYVIDTLRKDPLSRQAVIAIWDPPVDMTDGKDRACNTQLQFQCRDGRLYLTVTVRSNDVMWGWSGINAFEWSTLLEIVASLLEYDVGSITFNIGSLHLYEPHWGRAANISYDPPLVDPSIIPFNPDGIVQDLAEVDLLLDRWFIWEQICRFGEATLDLLEDWEDPLFKAWAAAIAYYWQRDPHWLEIPEMQGTGLAAAIAQTPPSVLPVPVQSSRGAVGVPSATHALNEPVRAFYRFTSKLHAEKHASYGDSWKKRGEKLSILANIARKVDRLGVGDSFDTAADTVIDLWVYLAKYLCWLGDQPSDPAHVDGVLLQSLVGTQDRDPEENWEDGIPISFDFYVHNIDEFSDERKREFVRHMLWRTAPVARDLWLEEQGTYRGADRD